MSYNNVSTFLSECEAPESYSFDYECDYDVYIELPIMDKYFVYCALRNNTTNSCYENGREYAVKIRNNEQLNNLADCDGSGIGGNNELIHDIYKTLWGWQKEHNSTFGRLNTDYFDGCFGADTMNSVQTSFNSYVKDKLDYCSEFRKIKGRRMVSNNLCLEYYTNSKVKDKFIHLINSDSNLTNYLSKYHTLGNFVLVPYGMNSWRGLVLKDYWDKTLLEMKKSSLGDNKSKLDFSKHNFIKYINYFFLWDYIDEAGDVKLISPENINNPGEKQLSEFWKKSTEIIVRRSEFIVKLLKIANEIGPEKYLMFRKEVFENPNELYKNYDEVDKVITKYNSN